MFKGTFVALITPFKDGHIDEKKLQSLVEWHINEGTDGLVPVGTTGESATLSHEEHTRVVEIVVKAARKRIPVLAGAGSNSTEEAIRLSREAKELWVDGILSVNPYYNKPTQDGLKAHFSTIAKTVNIPMVLYNIPSRTSVSLTPQTIAELASTHKNIVGVKEATHSMDQASEIIELTDHKFSVLSGDDSNTLPLLSIGAKGVISVVGNIVPKDVKKMCHLMEEGKVKEARALHAKLFPLIKALFLETNPAPIKAAMAELGFISSDEIRLPMIPVKDETRKKVKAALKAYGVKVPAGV